MSSSSTRLAALAAAVVALLVVGCGEGDQPERAFTAADAERLASVRPDGPDWEWPAQEERRIDSGRTKEEMAAEDPLFAAYLARTRGIPDPSAQGSRWKDADKLANLTVEVFETADDAMVAFDASNDLSRGYGEQYGSVSRVDEVDGLADEAWVLWASGGGQGVTYHWRRGNLLVEAARRLLRTLSCRRIEPRARGSTRSTRRLGTSA